MLRAQAPGAQVDVPGFPIDVNGGGMDIGCPAPVGVALGVADIMAELRGLAAQIALQLAGLLNNSLTI
jgi:hypothetical protein